MESTERHHRNKVKLKREAAAFDTFDSSTWDNVKFEFFSPEFKANSLSLFLSSSLLLSSVFLPWNTWKRSLLLQATRSQQIVEENEELLICDLIVGEEEHDSLILFTSSFVHVLQVRFQVRQAIGTGDHDHVGHVLANKGLNGDAYLGRGARAVTFGPTFGPLVDLTQVTSEDWISQGHVESKWCVCPNKTEPRMGEKHGKNWWLAPMKVSMDDWFKLISSVTWTCLTPAGYFPVFPYQWNPSRSTSWVRSVKRHWGDLSSADRYRQLPPAKDGLQGPLLTEWYVPADGWILVAMNIQDMQKKNAGNKWNGSWLCICHHWSFPTSESFPMARWTNLGPDGLETMRQMRATCFMASSKRTRSMAA